VTHYCRPRSRWHRALRALRRWRARRPAACMCYLVSAHPIVLRATGGEIVLHTPTEREDPRITDL
jgi:hypothetical protein